MKTKIYFFTLFLSITAFSLAAQTGSSGSGAPVTGNPPVSQSGNTPIPSQDNDRLKRSIPSPSDNQMNSSVPPHNNTNQLDRSIPLQTNNQMNGLVPPLTNSQLNQTIPPQNNGSINVPPPTASATNGGAALDTVKANTGVYANSPGYSVSNFPGVYGNPPTNYPGKPNTNGFYNPGQTNGNYLNGGQAGTKGTGAAPRRHWWNWSKH